MGSHRSPHGSQASSPDDSPSAPETGSSRTASPALTQLSTSTTTFKTPTYPASETPAKNISRMDAVHEDGQNAVQGAQQATPKKRKGAPDQPVAGASKALMGNMSHHRSKRPRKQETNQHAKRSKKSSHAPRVPSPAATPFKEIHQTVGRRSVSPAPSRSFSQARGGPTGSKHLHESSNAQVHGPALESKCGDETCFLMGGPCPHGERHQGPTTNDGGMAADGRMDEPSSTPDFDADAFAEQAGTQVAGKHIVAVHQQVEEEVEEDVEEEVGDDAGDEDQLEPEVGDEDKSFPPERHGPTYAYLDNLDNQLVDKTAELMRKLQRDIEKAAMANVASKLRQFQEMTDRLDRQEKTTMLLERRLQTLKEEVFHAFDRATKPLTQAEVDNVDFE